MDREGVYRISNFVRQGIDSAVVLAGGFRVGNENAGRVLGKLGRLPLYGQVWAHDMSLVVLDGRSTFRYDLVQSPASCKVWVGEYTETEGNREVGSGPVSCRLT